MGRGAAKRDDHAPDGAEIVPLNVPQRARPALAVVPRDPEMSGLLSLIGDAAGLVSAQRERFDAADRRASEARRRAVEAERRAEAAESRAAKAERLLQVAGHSLAYAERRIEAALGAVEAERRRAADLQRRSAEIVETMRSLLNEAGDRLRAAHSRAHEAEATCTAMLQAMRRRFAQA